MARISAEYAAEPNHRWPVGLVWVIVGDRATIETGIRELGFGTIHYMDADGNVAISEGDNAQ